MEILLERNLKSTTSMTMYLSLNVSKWVLGSLTMLQDLIEIKVVSVEFLLKMIEKVLLPIYILSKSIALLFANLWGIIKPLRHNSSTISRNLWSITLIICLKSSGLKIYRTFSMQRGAIESLYRKLYGIHSMLSMILWNLTQAQEKLDRNMHLKKSKSWSFSGWFMKFSMNHLILKDQEATMERPFLGRIMQSILKIWSRWTNLKKTIFRPMTWCLELQLPE